MNYNSELEGNNAGLRQILAAVNNLPDKGDEVTAETIAAALGYVPAKEESVNKLSEQIVDEERILELIRDELGVIENGTY